MENRGIPFCLSISCILQVVSSSLTRLVFLSSASTAYLFLLSGRICRTLPQSIRKGVWPGQKKMYHDEFGRQFCFGVYFAVEIVVLFDPIHGTDGNINTIISSWAVVVCYHYFIHQSHQISCFFLVYFLIGFGIYSVKSYHQFFAMAVCYLSQTFEEIFHAERVLVVGSDEGRLEENATVVRVGEDIFKKSKSFLHFFFFSAGKEENISLHSIDINPRNDLDVRVGSFCSIKILLAVVFANIELNSLIFF